MTRKLRVMFLIDSPAFHGGDNADPELRLAARYWHAILSFESDTRTLRMTVSDGCIVMCEEADIGQWVTITVTAPDVG